MCRLQVGKSVRHCKFLCDVRTGAPRSFCLSWPKRSSWFAGTVSQTVNISILHAKAVDSSYLRLTAISAFQRAWRRNELTWNKENLIQLDYYTGTVSRRDCPPWQLRVRVDEPAGNSSNNRHWRTYMEKCPEADLLPLLVFCFTGNSYHLLGQPVFGWHCPYISKSLKKPAVKKSEEFPPRQDTLKADFGKRQVILNNRLNHGTLIFPVLAYNFQSIDSETCVSL